jgi:hypothetical protein
MNTYKVEYDGWLEVEAADEEEAFRKAYRALSAWEPLPYDGTTGEWYVNATEKGK